MKRFLAAVLLVLAARARAQAPGTDQLRLQTNGGIGGDSTGAGRVEIYEGASAPPAPNFLKQLWWNASTGVLQVCTALSSTTCSTWTVPSTQGCTYVATPANFPGSPSNGQCAIARSLGFPAYYDSANSRWQSNGRTLGTSTYDDDLVAWPAVLNHTMAAPTIASSASAPTFTNGTHSCKVIACNSTGGCTDLAGATASATSASLSSQSLDLSNIPLGPAGTTFRPVGCTKAGSPGGDWYWIKTIADNTTTTGVNVGATDANLLIPLSHINWAGALKTAPVGSWSCVNSTGQTNFGGCGTDGANWVITGGTAGTPTFSQVTTDATIRLQYNASSFAGTDWRVIFQLTDITLDGVNPPTTSGPVAFSMRNGTSDAAIATLWAEAHAGNDISSSAAVATGMARRTTVSGQYSISGSGTTQSQPVPAITTRPYWYRIRRRLKQSDVTTLLYCIDVSTDGAVWRASNALNGTTGSTVNVTAASVEASPACSQVPVANEYDRLEWQIAGGAANTSGHYVRMTHFSMTNE